MGCTRVTSVLGSLAFAGAVALSFLACSGGPDAAAPNPGPDGEPGGFVSDNPGAAASTGVGGPSSGVGGAGGSGTGGGGGMGGSGGSAGTGNPGDDPGREIAEADIIQTEGDHLYALSRYGGLSVIDAARPEALQLLGRYRTEATPFEMYVKDGIVFALFTGWGKYVSRGNSWEWVQTSEVLALDARDPANIRSLAEFSVPGAISDSRIVGNVLYAVSREDGYCYDCAQNQPRTVVLSLDVADPAAVRKVDQLTFDDVNDQWGYSPRSISVTEQRIYVGGREWNASTSNGGSTIQVVDISDPGGDLVPGTTVRVEGQITSRWQMDEHQGTLRVLSQPWQGTIDAPVVQTFRVASSQEIAPLGRLPLVLPRPEQLQSTRFDGTRAYAITFQRTDPLFTIDLSDPALPKQMGELEMPGFVYHMEPRGDRLYGIGFDQGNAEGALNVSVFDVSNLAAPRMIERVNFGGNWGYLPEGQDQIHKAFRLLDSAGLIVVPFSGYNYDSTNSYCGSYRSGVQLIDFTRDDLALRGNVPSYGEARRAFLHKERLFTVSDDRVQSFDITDRDAPAKLGQLALARQVSAATVVGDHVVRLGNDWWANSVQIDTTTLDQPDVPTSLGSTDVESLLGNNSCGGGFYGARMLSHGDRAYLVYDDYRWSPSSGSSSQGTAVAVLDVSDPTNLRLESHVPVGEYLGYGWGGWGLDSVVSSGEQLVQLGSTLAFLRSVGSYADSGYPTTTSTSLEIADLSQPAAPKKTRLELPFRQGLTGLHSDGSTLLTSHFEPVPGSPNRVRFYVDRIDVSNPSAPRIVDKVNVPGSLLAWDAASRRAITVDYRRSSRENVTYTECYANGYFRTYFTPNSITEYEPSSTGTCHTVDYTLHQVRIEGSTAALEGSWQVPTEFEIGRAEVGTDRVFVGLNRPYHWNGDCYTGTCGVPSRAPRLVVLSGLGSGALNAASLDLAAQPWGGYIYHLAAFGDRALVAADSGSELLLVDAATPGAPKAAGKIETFGYVQSLTKHGNSAIIASGYDGVQIVDVSR